MNVTGFLDTVSTEPGELHWGVTVVARLALAPNESPSCIGFTNVQGYIL